jgi:pimeloyl-ACP methyl ester carboxylesterase
MSKTSKPSLDQIAIKRIEINSLSPTIIFLHDSLGCIQLWRDFPEQLGAMSHCNVLVYDRQGYGKSCPFSYPERDINYLEMEADLLNDLLEYWAIDNAILFGHSDGGSIALLTAAKYPTRIKGIITVGAHVFVEDVTIKGIKEAIDLYQNTDLKSKLEKYHGTNTEAMFWAWAKTWTTDKFKNWNIEQFLPLITCPALIIQGEDDEYGTLKQVEAITSKINGPITPLTIPDCKHTPYKEKPVYVLEQTALFIKRNLI